MLDRGTPALSTFPRPAFAVGPLPIVSGAAKGEGQPTGARIPAREYRHIAIRFFGTRKRPGQAAVELALAFPLFLLLIFGTIDVGRAILVRQQLVEAARAGSRLYSVRQNVPLRSVHQIIRDKMDAAQLEGYTVEFEPGPDVAVATLTPVSVTVSIPFDQVSWLARSWFLAGRTLQATCTMPADSTGQP